jgi:hypothetical protein
MRLQYYRKENIRRERAGQRLRTTSELLESLDLVTEEKSSVSEKYLRRMDRKCVHNSKFNFEIGDIVIIKKDFDSNANNRSRKFESFYSEEYEVVEILSNNRLKVKNEIEVSMNLVKEIKKVDFYHYI